MSIYALGMKLYKMTKLEIPKEKRIEILEELMSSDICGLKTLESYIYAKADRYNTDEDLTDLVRDVIALNGMVAMGETFSGVYSEHHDNIFDVYWTLKDELLTYCGFTDEDYKEVGY